MKGLSLLPLAVAGIAVAASAQPPYPGANSPTQRQQVARYAACLVDAHPHEAEQLLSLGDPSRADPAGIAAIEKRSPGCQPFHDRPATPPLVIAGGMAERLMERHFGFDTLPRYLGAGGKESPSSMRETEQRALICVARVSPRQTVQLFRTPAGSVAEARAETGLASGIEACAKGGRSIQYDTATLRARLALAAYRLAQLNAPATAPRSGN
jgi:hypothetical protein